MSFKTALQTPLAKNEISNDQGFECPYYKLRARSKSCLYNGQVRGVVIDFFCYLE